MSEKFVESYNLDIIQELLLEPDEDHEIDKLARKANIPSENVQAELKNLELLGLISSKKNGDKTLYKVNKESRAAEFIQKIMISDITADVTYTPTIPNRMNKFSFNSFL